MGTTELGILLQRMNEKTHWGLAPILSCEDSILELLKERKNTIVQNGLEDNVYLSSAIELYESLGKEANN